MGARLISETTETAIVDGPADEERAWRCVPLHLQWVSGTDGPRPPLRDRTRAASCAARPH